MDWIDLQVREIHELLKKQPSLGVVCLGDQSQSQFFFAQLQASGVSMRNVTLVQDSGPKYSLLLAE